jgi:hypothetical protein
MTGPEHYTEAERLLQAWDETMNESMGQADFEIQTIAAAPVAAVIVAAAQAHATLALAAANVPHPASHNGAWLSAVSS